MKCGYQALRNARPEIAVSLYKGSVLGLKAADQPRAVGHTIAHRRYNREGPRRNLSSSGQSGIEGRSTRKHEKKQEARRRPHLRIEIWAPVVSRKRGCFGW